MNGALRSRGITLVELLVVVAIIGVVAVVATPFLSNTNPHELDLAAAEMANAMRFARSEAIRTGEPHGFRLKPSEKRIQVLRPDTSTSPWTPIYDVYHPVSRQLYDISFSDRPFTVDDMDKIRVFRGTCDRPRRIYFDSSGTPWCMEPENVLVDYIEATLELGTHSRTVRLEGISGRVTVR